MNFKNQFSRMIFLLSFVCICACSENEVIENSLGSESYITDIIGEDLFSSVKSQNFIFHTGATPPTIDAIFRANTLQVQFSNIENDPALNQYNAPQVFAFFNQDNNNLTLDFDRRSEVIGSTSKDDAKIVGSDDKFTVFFEIPIQSNGYVNTYFEAISGRLTADGIQDFQHAFFMKERAPNAPANQFFPINTGRVFIETDGLAENYFLDLN